MLGNHPYCYPLTVTDDASRYLLTCEALSSTKGDYDFTCLSGFLKSVGASERTVNDEINKIPETAGENIREKLARGHRR